MTAAPVIRGLRPPGPRHVSLRARIGVLAAVAAAGAVILVSVVAFFIVRQNILASLDANLLQRATAAAQSELVDPQQLASTPTGALGAGDIRLALLYENGLAQSARGAATAPPLGEEELAVARGEAASSVRTATDGRVQYRVVAVDAGQGRALVIGQRLDATRAVLTRLGVALPAIGGVGVALAALAGAAVARTGLRPGAAADRGDRAGRGDR